MAKVSLFIIVVPVVILAVVIGAIAFAVHRDHSE